jgi:tetratricopeptide (TPR) repeat protein
MIRRDTRVFLSAVTRELSSVRKLVKKALEDNDYHAIEQDNFPADYRDLVDSDRERIDSCDAVIHIVGHCYGAEPPQRPADAARRSYTQLEWAVAVELDKPIFIFLIGDGFPVDPHEPESPELQALQEAHREYLISTDQNHNPVSSIEQLDQKIRGIRFKIERLAEELQQVDQKVDVHAGKLRVWLFSVAVLVVAALGALGFVGWRQRVAYRAQRQESARQQAEREKQERERVAAEAARNEAHTIQQVQREIAENLLQELVNDKSITAEDARRRALTRLSAVKLPLVEIQSLIDQRIAPRANDASLSPLERAQAALAKGNYDEVFRAADEQKQQDRELAMLEGTAALARFRQSPKPEWNARALAAFERAMALADPDSPTDSQAWAEAAVAAAEVRYELASHVAAESLLRQCQRIREARNGPDSREVAQVLNNLALLLTDTNRRSEAEPLYRRALAIDEKSYSPDHPEVAVDLNNLALLLQATNRVSEAEPLMRCALAIDEKSSGPDDPTVAIRLNNLSKLLSETNRLSQAEPLIRRALAIDEKSYGPEHPDVARFLSNLAELLCATNRLSEAEPLYRRALAIDQRSSGPDHPNVARDLNNMALLLGDTNRLAEAEPLYRRALAINEKSWGPAHPLVAKNLNNLATLLQSSYRVSEAESLFRRALAIDEKSYGPDHPAVAIDLNNLADLLKDTNRLSQAEPLYRRALAIGEKSYGPDHPQVATHLNNLAVLLHLTSRRTEAEPLYRRALSIDEKSYGPDHTDVARDLRNLALLLQATNRLSDAEPLIARTMCVFLRFQRSTGHEHPYLQDAVDTYRKVLIELKLAEPEIAARIKAAGGPTDKLSPIVPEVERLLGPSRTVADVLNSLDRQYKDQGKLSIHFLKPSEPIAPRLDELLRPNADQLNAEGNVAFRRGAHADAAVLYEAALDVTATQPAKALAELRARMNRASALRELGFIAQARDELVRLLPQLDQDPAVSSGTKGRARYHLALCQWRLGDPASAQRSVEESLATYDLAPKANQADPARRRQSEELLGDLKANKAPPPLAAIDATAALEAARARYRAREALTNLPLNQQAAPLLDKMLGQARSTDEVFDALDRYYGEHGKPTVWLLPLKDPIAPHLDRLLGPTKPVNEVLESLDRQYRAQGNPAIWFLPLNEPIAPHLDELLGKLPG